MITTKKCVRTHFPTRPSKLSQNNQTSNTCLTIRWICCLSVYFFPKTHWKYLFIVYLRRFFTQTIYRQMEFCISIWWISLTSIKITILHAVQTESMKERFSRTSRNERNLHLKYAYCVSDVLVQCDYSCATSCSVANLCKHNLRIHRVWYPACS